MRTALLTLAAFCVTVGAALPTSAQSSSAGPAGGGSYPDYGGAAGLAGAPAAVGIQVIAPTYYRGAFSLSDAYPFAAVSHPAAQGIAELQCLAGRCPAPCSVPGAL